MTNIRIAVQNTSPTGGTFLTPFWFAAHNEGFDVFNTGEAASSGLEALAEDGNFAPINAEVTAFDADAQTGAVVGAAGPIATNERTAATLTVDAAQNAYLSLTAMILPSNDAFVGTEEAIQLFDEDGNFLGGRTLNFEGADVLDAGTEVNTELDAAFINQTGPNTGEDENGVVGAHEGFLPEGEGSILGGENAAGAFIDPQVADFTQPGAGIARVHINEFVETTGTNRSEVILGDSADDIVAAGAGHDVILGRGGWDEIDGGNGRDLIKGGNGWDVISGGNGNDNLFGNRGRDILDGGNGRDFLNGGSGNDTLDGGNGNDTLRGGLGDDTFIFGDSYDRDVVRRFDADHDHVQLDIEGIVSFEDLADLATTRGNRTVLDFGQGDVLVLTGVEFDELSSSNFDIL